ncbi:MAG: hypothetical protein IIB38_08190 [Candidatus Hydrogenedentes bacterium]|nr:hypothetical protein [Candidatus Hydrogenedentota bacterium]
MARKKNKDKIFNDRPRKIFRHYIGRSEVAFSAFFVLFTIAMGAWFVMQRDNYDPGERDISMEVMIAQQVEDHLWEPPLELWFEPGSQPARSGAPSIDLGIFPPQTLGGGWRPASRVEVFDASNLYEKIDGQETQYKAFGFQSLHFISIEDPEKGLDVNIELYDMDNFPNALGIFAAQRSAGSKVQREGKAFLYLTEAGALGIVDKYYFKFTGNEDSETIRNHALLVINAFSESVAESGDTPRAFMVLAEGMGVNFQDIEYIKEDVFQYDFAQDFWFGRRGEDSTAKYYLHEAGSEQKAIKLFDQIMEEHLYEYTLVSRDGNNAVMKHDFLETYFTLNQKGRYVFGIDGAADEDQAIQALDALAAKLSDEMA